MNEPPTTELDKRRVSKTDMELLYERNGFAAKLAQCQEMSSGTAHAEAQKIPAMLRSLSISAA